MRGAHFLSVDHGKTLFFGICHSLPCENDAQETFKLSKNLTQDWDSTGTSGELQLRYVSIAENRPSRCADNNE